MKGRLVARQASSGSQESQKSKIIKWESSALYIARQPEFLSGAKEDG